MQYKAIIFDLDGTLLDTIEDLSDSMNAVLEKKGFPTHSVEEYKYFIGHGIHKLVERALPANFRNERSIKEHADLMRQEYKKRWNNKTRPYEGIPELLGKLEEKGILMAVLSNKADDFTKVIISELLPHWKFEVVFGERSNVPRKPDPSAALEIANILGVQPKNFIFLGDSESDMITATAAGMYGIGALWGFRTKEELLSSGAKAVIQHPLDLLNYL
ncbi:MAG TPA: HAD family hydrolase [Clostridiaceae bacterium]|nr:HAD family hydrolase [Clostridiaceae bacterium]